MQVRPRGAEGGSSLTGQLDIWKQDGGPSLFIVELLHSCLRAVGTVYDSINQSSKQASYEFVDTVTYTFDGNGPILWRRAFSWPSPVRTANSHFTLNFEHNFVLSYVHFDRGAQRVFVVRAPGIQVRGNFTLRKLQNEDIWGCDERSARGSSPFVQVLTSSREGFVTVPCVHIGRRQLSNNNLLGPLRHTTHARHFATGTAERLAHADIRSLRI